MIVYTVNKVYIDIHFVRYAFVIYQLYVVVSEVMDY